MASEKRPYRKKRRAEQEAETRRRITRSAVELHGSVGPARTTMSAVADRAGVRRSTLYRHFPHEKALFAACSAHWGEENPPPDPAPWAGIDEPAERLETALRALYAYYRRTDTMFANVLRDEPLVPVLTDTLDDYRGYLEEVRKLLMRGRPERGRTRRAAEAAIGHALAFATWKSLTEGQGLADEEAAGLMASLPGAGG